MIPMPAVRWSTPERAIWGNRKSLREREDFGRMWLAGVCVGGGFLVEYTCRRKQELRQPRRHRPMVDRDIGGDFRNLIYTYGRNKKSVWGNHAVVYVRRRWNFIAAKRRYEVRHLIVRRRKWRRYNRIVEINSGR